MTCSGSCQRTLVAPGPKPVPARRCILRGNPSRANHSAGESSWCSAGPAVPPLPVRADSSNRRTVYGRLTSEKLSRMSSSIAPTCSLFSPDGPPGVAAPRPQSPARRDSPHRVTPLYRYQADCLDAMIFVPNHQFFPRQRGGGFRFPAVHWACLHSRRPQRSSPPPEFALGPAASFSPSTQIPTSADLANRSRQRSDPPTAGQPEVCRAIGTRPYRRIANDCT